MVTICPPNYANVFTGKFERTFIYPYIRTFANFFCRFTDDLFLQWNVSQRELLDFIAKLNTCRPNINLIINILNTA